MATRAQLEVESSAAARPRRSSARFFAARHARRRCPRALADLRQTVTVSGNTSTNPKAIVQV
jgi:hypothetical protein